MINRKPVFAGSFYEASFAKLEKQIKGCFYDKFGPGDLPAGRSRKRAFCIICPHAAYKYSGQCAAWAHKEIAEAECPELFIVVGPNHSGIGPGFATFLFSDWETPFGTAGVDKDSGQELMKQFKKLENNWSVHQDEHSIEVQLPFLQLVNMDKLNEIKFLPIAVGGLDFKSCKELGHAIAGLEKDFVLIVSSDFTHYGRNYGYVPFVHNKKENLYRMDREAIEFIKNFDSEGFYNFVLKKRATICGAAPIIVGIEACKAMKAREIKRCRLLQYYASGDITGDFENCVGYGALVFS